VLLKVSFLNVVSTFVALLFFMNSMIALPS
jgi:hypothetical protein